MKFAKWVLAVTAIALTMAAYPPSKATISLTPPSVLPGAAVTATLCGFEPGETVIVTIDGAVVASAVADAEGCATVSFDAPFQVGEVTVTAAGQSSGKSATTILTVQAAAPVATTTTQDTSNGKSPLPTTGMSVDQTLRAAGGLVIAGVGVLIVSVRRQSDRDRAASRRRARH